MEYLTKDTEKQIYSGILLNKPGNNVDEMCQENSEQVYGNRITEGLGCENDAGTKRNQCITNLALLAVLRFYDCVCTTLC